MSESVRCQILSTALSLTSDDRAKTYGDSDTNMQAYAELRAWWNHWRNTLQLKSDPHDAAMEMVLAKLSRIAVGIFHKDNYIDAAAYLAIAVQAECSARDKAGPYSPGR